MNRFAFYLRQWYWSRPFHVRVFLDKLPDWLFAIFLGGALGWLAGWGF